MKSILRWMKKFVLKNWGLKLTSILIAFALWIMVRGTIVEQVIPVQLRISPPSDMVLVGDYRKSVDITIQGFQSSFTSSQPNLDYNLDLMSFTEPGTYTVPLTPSGVRLSPTSGQRVISVNPARMDVVLDKQINKAVPVEVTYSGRLAEGFELYDVTPIPKDVDISGPSSVIEPIKVLETLPVQLEDRSLSFETQANLNVPSDDIHTSAADGPISAVLVSVELGPHREVMPIRVPITVLDGEDYTVSPPNVTVNLMVPVTYKAKLTADDFEATVSVSGMDPTANQARVAPVVTPVTELIPEIDWRISPEVVTITRRPRKK